MSQNKLFEALHPRLARLTVGPSTVRGKGNAGVLLVAREFLTHVSLPQFATNEDRKFRRHLDLTTDLLCKSFPPAARHWGLARKVLNIFLRDCFYSWHLCTHWNLHRAEHSFELPLDGIVGRKLNQIDPQLPRWDAIKRLTPVMSDAFQASAQQHAKSLGLTRVHLDALWWGASNRND